MSGQGVVASITYSNSFTPGDIVYRTVGGYAKSKADSAANAEVHGVVQSATGSDFVVVYSGPITGLTGLNDSAVYFLSDTVAGSATQTAPTALGTINKPVFVATSATTAIIVNMRGIETGNQVSTFLTAVPALSSSAGGSGYWAVNSTHFYIYDTTTSAWRRTAISAF